MIRQFDSFAAPLRYVFVDPDTQYNYEAPTKEALISHITVYREQNQLPPLQALDAILQNYWCSLPENLHLCRDVPLKRGWFKYLRGGIALLENVFYGEDNMISPTLAEKRAQICTSCPYNVFPDKTGFLAWSDELAENATGGKKVPSHDNLGNCAVCSCTLKAKVWYKGPFKQEDFPSHCWQLKKDKPNE